MFPAAEEVISVKGKTLLTIARVGQINVIFWNRVLFDAVLAAEYESGFISLLNWRFRLVQWTFRSSGPVP